MFVMAPDIQTPPCCLVNNNTQVSSLILYLPVQMPSTSSNGESSSPSSGDEPATKKLKELMTTFATSYNLYFTSGILI